MSRITEHLPVWQWEANALHSKYSLCRRCPRSHRWAIDGSADRVWRMKRAARAAALARISRVADELRVIATAIHTRRLRQSAAITATIYVALNRPAGP